MLKFCVVSLSFTKKVFILHTADYNNKSDNDLSYVKNVSLFTPRFSRGLILLENIWKASNINFAGACLKPSIGV